MKPLALMVLIVFGGVTVVTAEEQGLLEARAGFETTLIKKAREAEPLAPPPDSLFSLVHYESPAGKMAAYLGKSPEAGRKHPAIIWITGGFPPGGIGSGAWEQRSVDNDQSAKAYRNAGMVMMYPALRGSFGNPGHQESFYGELDDVLAAAEYLSQVDYVDPEAIYLGGHSTGGTLALLVAAATGRFRAVFAFGPTHDPAGYGADALTYDPTQEKENRLRSPVHFLGAIVSPTFVIEGIDGNLGAMQRLKEASSNDKIEFATIDGGGHFDVLAPLNRFIAGKITTKEPLAMTAAELQEAFDEFRVAQREASDLQTLAYFRRTGVDITQSRRVQYYLYSRRKSALEAAGKMAAKEGFEPRPTKTDKDDEGNKYYVLILDKTLTLSDLEALFNASKKLAAIAEFGGHEYDGWNLE